MKYVVTVNGERFEVEVERAGRGTSSLSRGPVERRATAQPVAAPAPVAPAQPVAAPTPTPAAAPAASGSGNNVVAPMPGTILDIKVAVGDAVSEGDAVVVLEAMKMENEITTEFTGTVASINVKKGDTVDTDAVLIEIK